ncbi:glycine-rich domain-containing protein 1-like [Bidens hawaiensis]|uniref:glycine-rich domain-containing protein 1-like n=1 Tax=Bidens hawaiensis TaxID=980011 RepID=UPI004049C5E7
MDRQLNREWVEAQQIVISTNLIAAAKKHLQFLEVVHKYGELFDGPLLEKAIFRYKYHWLPLLSEHTESSQLPKIPLVVPLDCEWIWHCHRLNPVRYMVDFIELFGKILDPDCVVVSSIDGACKKQTEDIWKKKYPQEAYELEFGFKNDNQTLSANLQSTNYDLVAAVTRQSSFFHKVSCSIFKEDLYLEEAVKRYKGFLHLVSKNMEKKLDNPVVPTYDIDLIWHTHQLSPRSYCKDAINLVGQVLHHDDNDTDQSKGGMLDVGIKTTTQQWKEMFGSEYLRVLSRPSVHMKKRADSFAMTGRCMCLPDQDGSSAINYYTIKAEEDSSEMTTRCMMKARCTCLPEQDGPSAKSAINYYTIKAEEDSSIMAARCMMTTMRNPEESTTPPKLKRSFLQ